MQLSSLKKKKKKNFSTHQVPLINPKMVKGKLTSLEIQKP